MGQFPRFPLFVDLTEKRVVLVGGGNIALRRVKTLLQFGAQVVVISPIIWTRPVVQVVSQATRAPGSCFRIASRIASEIWSQILSGCPSVTDSEVNRYLDMVSCLLFNGKMCGSERQLDENHAAHPVTAANTAKSAFPTHGGKRAQTLIFRFPAGIGTLRHAQVAGLHRACSLSHS